MAIKQAEIIIKRTLKKLSKNSNLVRHFLQLILMGVLLVNRTRQLTDYREL